ncbi:L-threonine synthase [Isosphaera pallida ATCC 43644]|uniref:Threonine synthase n=1 Tax=Isosphaera pallida (strain ATCC 43644 / DSM 9630 / IS1B) TaxID=575540 RepID=E8QXL0_ISOPI|nr:threonine synthase [Isosphaera pallida]ADV63058.1 L-threonine synthase [Isosphaera pallida ATCC 43644]
MTTVLVPSVDPAHRLDGAFQRCLNLSCGATFGIEEPRFSCPVCGDLLDVTYDWDRLPVPTSLHEFEAAWSDRGNPLNFSGVWRFRRLLPFAPESAIVTIGEGQTLLQTADAVASYVGVEAGRLKLQYEGMNPSGSFKDNGMTAAFTHARMVGARRVACASTGNTSAALAVYCSATPHGFKAIIFIGSGKIAYGKLAQALDHGALTIQIVGDFDDAMARVRQVADRLGIYLMNSVNPFRLEGQKTIMYRVLEASNWEPPDWIVVPGGNLGNSSAFGKAFAELKELGLLKRLPRLAVVNAAGASTLDHLYNQAGMRWCDGEPDLRLADGYYRSLDAEGVKADTIASAIEINRPVNLKKCLRALSVCDGVVTQVSDQEILDAKAQVGSGGLGCEPASAASVAGARRLRREGIIAPSDQVVCVLTGHQLKDPNATVAYHSGDRDLFDHVLGKRGVLRAGFANRPVVVPNDLDDIIRSIALYSADAGPDSARREGEAD